MSKQLVKFISVWDGYGEVISDAVFDNKTKLFPILKSQIFPQKNWQNARSCSVSIANLMTAHE